MACDFPPWHTLHDVWTKENQCGGLSLKLATQGSCPHRRAAPRCFPDSGETSSIKHHLLRLETSSYTFYNPWRASLAPPWLPRHCVGVERQRRRNLSLGPRLLPLSLYQRQRDGLAHNIWGMEGVTMLAFYTTWGKGSDGNEFGEREDFSRGCCSLSIPRSGHNGLHEDEHAKHAGPHASWTNTRSV